MESLCHYGDILLAFIHFKMSSQEAVAAQLFEVNLVILLR